MEAALVISVISEDYQLVATRQDHDECAMTTQMILVSKEEM